MIWLSESSDVALFKRKDRKINSQSTEHNTLSNLTNICLFFFSLESAGKISAHYVVSNVCVDNETRTGGAFIILQICCLSRMEVLRAHMGEAVSYV